MRHVQSRTCRENSRSPSFSPNKKHGLPADASRTRKKAVSSPFIFIAKSQTVPQHQRQPCGKRPPQADGQQHNDIADQIRQRPFKDGNDGHSVNLVAGIETHTHRRSYQTDSQTGDHHSAKLQSRKSIILHNRKHNGRQKKDGGAHVNKRADHQDHHAEHQGNPPRRHVKPDKEIGHDLGNLLHGQNPGKYGGKADDDHDGGGRDQSLLKGLQHSLPGQLLVHEKSHKKRIQHRHTCALRCGTHAKGNADNDEQRHQKRGNPRQNGGRKFLKYKGSPFGVPSPPVADDIYQNQLGRSDQKPRHCACHKQRAYGSPGNHGVDDHRR